MKQLTLVVDLLLDETDLVRVQNNRVPYLYTPDSNSLYPKHINHFDYHHPILAVSYGKDNHELINLENTTRNQFHITHQNLDKQNSVAMGITDSIAMIALGDTTHTRIQVVDANQPLKVFLNESYSDQQDTGFFPLPRYFTGNSEQAVLVYSDNSRLPIDLSDFELGIRQPAEIDRIISSKTILSPHLSILGPFILISITPDMSNKDLVAFELLIDAAANSSWYAVDNQTLVNEDLVTVDDFDEIINQQKKKISKIQRLVDGKKKEYKN